MREAKSDFIQKKPVSNIAEIYICTETKSRYLYASVNISVGEVIEQLGIRRVVSEPTYLTLQADDNKHILLEPEFLQYANHSCDPNVYFDIDSGVVRTLRNISKNEQITFFYPSTEWRMNRPFDCLCNSEKCLGRIAGAAFIPAEILSIYDVSSYIKKKANLSKNPDGINKQR